MPVLARPLRLISCLIPALWPLAAATAEPVNCVQFVERNTALALHGNAWEWWGQAAAQYDRGKDPWPGGVMVFGRTGRLPHGHLAVVAGQIDGRTILVDHANWSPLQGRRGRVERAVQVVDVSPANDWSAVRVWYGPSAGIGQRVYPVSGFVYPWHPARPQKPWEKDPLSNHLWPR